MLNFSLLHLFHHFDEMLSQHSLLNNTGNKFLQKTVKQELKAFLASCSFAVRYGFSRQILLIWGG